MDTLSSNFKVFHAALSIRLSAGIPAAMVELVRSGHTPEELAPEFEPTAQSIFTWVKQAERDAGKRADGPGSAARRITTTAQGKNRMSESRQNRFCESEEKQMVSWCGREDSNLHGLPR